MVGRFQMDMQVGSAAGIALATIAACTGLSSMYRMTVGRYTESPRQALKRPCSIWCRCGGPGAGWIPAHSLAGHAPARDKPGAVAAVVVAVVIIEEEGATFTGLEERAWNIA